MNGVGMDCGVVSLSNVDVVVSASGVSAVSRRGALGKKALCTFWLTPHERFV